MALSYGGIKPELMRDVLLADTKLVDYHNHIDKMNPVMLGVASKLARKWGRTAKQLRRHRAADMAEG